MSMSSLKFLFSNGGKAASENDEVFALAEAKFLAWSKSKIIIYNASELTRGRWDPWPDDVDVLLIFMDILAINFDSSRHYAIVGKLIGRTPKQVGGLIKTSCDKYDITFPMTRETRSARDAMGRSIIQGEGSLGQCNKFVQIVFFNVESPYGDLTDPKVVKESAKKMSRNARPADKEDLEKSTQLVLSTVINGQKDIMNAIQNLSLKFDSAATHDDLATSTADAGATVATEVALNGLASKLQVGEIVGVPVPVWYAEEFVGGGTLIELNKKSPTTNIRLDALSNFQSPASITLSVPTAKQPSPEKAAPVRQFDSATVIRGNPPAPPLNYQGDFPTQWSKLLVEKQSSPEKAAPVLQDDSVTVLPRNPPPPPPPPAQRSGGGGCDGGGCGGGGGGGLSLMDQLKAGPQLKKASERASPGPPLPPSAPAPLSLMEQIIAARGIQGLRKVTEEEREAAKSAKEQVEKEKAASGAGGIMGAISAALNTRRRNVESPGSGSSSDSDIDSDEDPGDW